MPLALIALLWFLPSFGSNTVAFDFGTKQDGTSWRAINDGVMGGLSRGVLTVTDSSLVFSGQLSFANNGGFTSFRAPFGAYDLSHAGQVRIRYRSEGTTFALMLEPTDVFYLPHYRLPLPGTEGAWSELSLPVSDIRQFRLNSERPGEIESEELRKLIRIGFISSDKNTDPFTFEIDYLNFQ
jgi:Complex I intermediate-associated protein 30 (CIA30).